MSTTPVIPPTAQTLPSNVAAAVEINNAGTPKVDTGTVETVAKEIVIVVTNAIPDAIPDAIPEVEDVVKEVEAVVKEVVEVTKVEIEDKEGPPDEVAANAEDKTTTVQGDTVQENAQRTAQGPPAEVAAKAEDSPGAAAQGGQNNQVAVVASSNGDVSQDAVVQGTTAQEGEADESNDNVITQAAAANGNSNVRSASGPGTRQTNRLESTTGATINPQNSGSANANASVDGLESESTQDSTAQAFVDKDAVVPGDTTFSVAGNTAAGTGSDPDAQAGGIGQAGKIAAVGGVFAAVAILAVGLFVVKKRRSGNDKERVTSMNPFLSLSPEIVVDSPKDSNRGMHDMLFKTPSNESAHSVVQMPPLSSSPAPSSNILPPQDPSLYDGAAPNMHDSIILGNQPWFSTISTDTASEMSSEDGWSGGELNDAIDASGRGSLYNSIYSAKTMGILNSRLIIL
jgi:hypothetical protein